MTFSAQQIHRWITQNAAIEALVPTQFQQIGLRMLFGIFTAFFVWFHGERLGSYTDIYWAALSVYFVVNFFFAFSIRLKPVSAFRALFGPLLDVALVAVAMFIDGGQASSLYPLFIIIVLGNGLRYGNSMLIYTQTLSISAIILIAITEQITNDHIDFGLLLLQCLIMLATPLYSFKLSRISEEAIQKRDEAEQTSFGLLDHGPLPAFTFKATDNNDLSILYANGAMQQLYEESISDLIGKQVNALALHEDGEEVQRACLQALGDTSEESHRFYFRAYRQDKEISRMMGQAMRIHWHGDLIGVCFLLDVTKTESMRNDFRQNAQSGYMSTLVAGIVHDFRNVLTSIIGTAEVLQFSTQDKLTQERLSLIMSAGERGSEMITHLLNLSKPKQEAAQHTIDATAMYHSLASIIGLLRIQLPAHITLHCDIDEQLPAISADITQMEQIISNLVVNASHAITDEGNIRIALSPESGHPLASKSSPAVKITIADDGCGISKENLQNITEPFWTSRKDEGGTGLGLSMVERIVRSHNGQLLIDSEPGRGTTITIYLPPADARPQSPVREQPQLPATPAVEPQPDIRPCSVLLVDDTPEVLQVHQSMLERMGLNVATANNGVAALEYFKAHRKEVDMVISDFRMPGMDGMDFAIAVRNLAPEIPISIITAYGEVDKLQLSHNHNIKVLSKPITFKKLMQEMSEQQKSHGI